MRIDKTNCINQGYSILISITGMSYNQKDEIDKKVLEFVRKLQEEYN